MKPVHRIMGVLVLFVFMLISQGCISSSKRFDTILKSPHKFHGNEIVITGIFRYNQQECSIYPSKGGSADNAIQVKLSDMFMLLNTFEQPYERKVKITGFFDLNDKGTSGKYFGTLKEAQIVGLK